MQVVGDAALRWLTFNILLILRSVWPSLRGVYAFAYIATYE